MDIRNCAKCGRLFNYMGGPPICQACREKEEESFQVVKDYIYEHKDANMMQISNETGVSTKLIERFIKEGRLILTEDSPIFLRCEKCGKEVKTGRFCSDCSRSLSNEMRMSSTPPKEESPSKPKSEKMRFLNKDRL